MAEEFLLELDELHSSVLSLCEDVRTQENQTSNPSVDMDNVKPCEDISGNVEHLFMNSPSVGKERFNYNIRLSPIRKVKEDDKIFVDSGFEFDFTPKKTDLKFDLSIDSTPKVKPSLMGLLLKARSTSTPLSNKWNTVKFGQCHSKSPGDRYIGNKVHGSSSTAGRDLDVIPEIKNDGKAYTGTNEFQSSRKRQTEDDGDENKSGGKSYNKTDNCDQTYDELLEDLSILCQTELSHLSHGKLTDYEETNVIEPLSQIKSEHYVSQINIHSILKETKAREELERSTCKNVLTTTQEHSEGEECKAPGRFCGVNTTSHSRTSLCKIDDSFEECVDILGLDKFLISSDDDDDEDKLDLTESSDETLLNQETILLQIEDRDIQSKLEDIQSENRDIRSEDRDMQSEDSGINSEARDVLSNDRDTEEIDIYISEERGIRSEVRDLQSIDRYTQSKERDEYSEDIESVERDIQSKGKEMHSEGVQPDDRNIQSKDRDIHSEDIQSDERDIQSKDGDMLSEDIQSDERDIQSKDGDMLSEDIQSDERDIQSKDRDMHSENIQSDERDIHPTDGDIYSEDIQSKDRDIVSEDIQSNERDIQSKDRDMNSEDIHLDERDIQSKDRDMYSEDIQSNERDIQSKDRDMHSENIQSDEGDIQSKDRDMYLEDIQSKDRDIYSEDIQLDERDIQSKDRDIYSEDIQSDERDIQSKDRDRYSEDIQSKDRDMHSEDTDVHSEKKDIEISDAQNRNVDNGSESSSEKALDKVCVLEHGKKRADQDGMKQDEESDDDVDSESDTSTSEEFELDLTKYSDEIDDFLVEEGLRSESWRNTDKKAITISAQEIDKKNIGKVESQKLFSDSLKKWDMFDYINPEKGVSQAEKAGKKNEADCIQKEGLCSSLNRRIGSRGMGVKEVGPTVSRRDEISDICDEKEELSLRSFQDSDDIDSFLQREGFQVIDDWKYESGSVQSSPVCVSPFNSVAGWKDNNISKKHLPSSGASSLEAETFTGPQLSLMYRKVDNKDSLAMTRQSPVNIKSKPSADYSKGSTTLRFEWNEIDTEVVKSGTKERVSAITGKNEKRQSKNNMKRRASMKNDENGPEYGKRICEVFPVKAEFSGKFEKSEWDSINNSAASHELPLAWKRPFHSSDCQGDSSESGFGAQIKKRRAPLLPTPSFNEKSQNFTSSRKPPITKWSLSPPKNNFCENIQKISQSQPNQRSVKVQPFYNEAERNYDAWNSQLHDLNHCDSSVYWAPLNESRSHPENVNIEMSNDAKKKILTLDTHEQEMQSNGHRRSNFPPTKNQWRPELKGQKINSNKKNKQKHTKFNDFRAKRQFIQNENDLTHEVMNKWKTQGIQSPNINLTYAARLRQEGRGRQGRLEGKRNSTLYNPDDEGVDTINKKNRHGRLDDSHQKWDSKSMLNDINKLKRQINEVNKAKKAAVDSVVDEYSMEKNRLARMQGNRMRELWIRQDAEMRRLQHQSFINPSFVQYQLLQLRCEHTQQKEHLRLFMCKEQKALEESYESKVHGLVKRYDEKRQQLSSLINQLKQQKVTDDVSSPHVMTSFKSRYNCSKITVCLPIDIATSLVHEDEVYDSYYSQ